MDERTRDRINGCAVGAAVGDALGMPLEFGAAIPTGRLVREMTPGRLPAGSFTDDTEMALAMAESLIECGELDPADVAKRFVGWMKGWPPDVGNQTRRALSWIEQGLPWDEACRRMLDSHPNSAGNGSLMRCWPAALFAWKDEAKVIAASRLQSQVTHPQPLCVEACVLVNVMICRLVQGDSIEAAYRRALELPDLPPLLREAAVHAPTTSRERLPNTGYVRDTLESALWGLLNTDSFEECVVQVANLGDDADTAACVAGALAGAAYGLENIPERWQTALRGEWPLRSGTVLHMQDLADLAGRLAALQPE